MLIYGIRKWFTKLSSIGTLSIKGDSFTCSQIEDVARASGVKIPKETAIPPGIYRIGWTWSARHNCMKPEILDVPNFTGVRFDIANKASQLEGCVAVGFGKDIKNDAVWDSASAYKILCDKIQAALDRGELVWYDISNQQEKI